MECLLVLTTAGTAPATPTVRTNVDVVAHIIVTLGTLDCRTPTPVTSTNVLGVRDRLQVVGTYAMPDPAQVVEFQSGWHGTVFKLPERAVG